MEIFDCEMLSDAPLPRLDEAESHRAEHLRRDPRVVELSTTITPFSTAANKIDCGAMCSSTISAAAWPTLPTRAKASSYGNRLYNNTFYDNRCFALVGYGRSQQHWDNRAVNNLLQEPHCEGKGDQMSIADRGAVIATGNAVESKDPGFVDESKPDLHLKSDSPMIDRAGP